MNANDDSDAEDTDSWIDVKKDTDTLDNEQIRKLIEETLFGDAYKEFEEIELSSKLEIFNIDDWRNAENIEILPSILRNPEESLIKRERSVHLTFDQKLYVYRCYKDGEALSNIWQRTGISLSTAKRIAKDFSTKLTKGQQYTKIRWRKMIGSPLVIKWIADYISEQTKCFTAAHIQTHIIKEHLIVIPLHQIRQHLKLVHNLSYKKGNSRPAQLDTNRIRLLKQYFWVKLARRLSDVKILVNIDESTIQNDTCCKYSWLERGKSWSITNILFKKSINTISAVATNGLWINMFKHVTTTKEIVITFIKYVLKYLRINMQLNPSEIGIVLDNWAPHRAKLVKKYWMEVGVKMYYLPQYSPEFAPIELYFSKLKNDLIKAVGRESLDLESDRAKTLISKCVKRIDKEYWLRIWARILKKVRIELAGLNNSILE